MICTWLHVDVYSINAFFYHLTLLYLQYNVCMNYDSLAAEMTRAALTRNNELHQRTIMWMRDYFMLHADACPNSLEWHLELCTKQDIWELYKREIQIEYQCEQFDKGQQEYVTYDIFLSMWKTVFPYVKIRVYKQVSGKCWTCHRINEVRMNSENKSTLLAAKELHQLHRGGLYMLERQRYDM